MPVPSLHQLAVRTAVRNVKDIDSIEGMTYSLAKPFLVKVDNPDQLGALEKSEPSIYGETTELWRTLIMRDAPGYFTQGGNGPKRPENWYKVYKKAVKEDQDRIDQNSAALKAAMDQQTAAKTQQQTTMLTSISKIPSGKRSRSAAFGRQPVANPGSRTKIVGGRGLLERARREARDAKVMSKRNVEPSTSLLPSRPSSSATPSMPPAPRIANTAISGQRPLPSGVPTQARPANTLAPRPGLKKPSSSAVASRAADLPASSSAALAGHSLPSPFGPQGRRSVAPASQASPSASRDSPGTGVAPKTNPRQPGTAKVGGNRRPVNIFATPPRRSRPV